MSKLNPCGGFLVALLLVHAVAAQTSTARERVIANEPGVPLASRLRADDEIVVVKGDAHGAVFEGKPTAAQLLRYYTDTADVAILIDVSSVAGVLSDDQSSISTRIDGTIAETVLARKGSLKPGQQIEVRYAAGGELRIGTVLVKFGNRISIARGRNLLFLRSAGDGHWYPTATPLTVRGDKVFNLAVEAGAGFTAVHDLPLADVIAHIREFAKTKQLPLPG